jgi:hypothetical protein
MKRPILITLFLAATIILGACKSKTETKADEYLAAGKLRNALRLYMKVEEKGKQSEEFNDNYSLALTRAMAKAAKSDPAQTVINNYLETIPKYLETSQNQAVLSEFVSTMADVATKKIDLDMFSETVEGFNVFKTAQKFAKNSGTGKATLETTIKSTSEKYLASIFETVDGIDDTVAKEYYLLEAQKVLGVGENAKLEEKLMAVRKKNLGNFLIWAPDVNGVKPSRLVDVNGYVFAFRAAAVKQTATSLSGHLQVWNTSGNNTEIKPEEIILVGKDGTTQGSKSKVGKKCAKRFDSEKDCTTAISFSFAKGFKPDHILIKNSDGEGRKFLGT